MNFKQFDYAMESVDAVDSVMETVEELHVTLDEKLVATIVKQLATSAVLLYCTPAFKELLTDSKVVYTSVDTEDTIDT